YNQGLQSGISLEGITQYGDVHLWATSPVGTPKDEDGLRQGLIALALILFCSNVCLILSYYFYRKFVNPDQEASEIIMMSSKDGVPGGSQALTKMTVAPPTAVTAVATKKFTS
ncbi:hypothetical protein CYMTET_28426, partial [Cymbomonas tetramitiformis]